MSIEIIEHPDRLQINLPPVTCLLSDEGQQVVSGLIEVAEKVCSPGFTRRYVSLLLCGPASDRNMKWYDDLSRRLVLSETFSRIMTFRWLLSLIRKSPVPWVFFAADDCLGTTWELALSCSRRYWFSETAQVGFPEVQIGGFPSGGSAEAMAKTNPKFHEFWDRTPVVASREAFANDFVSFCSPIGADWATSYNDLLIASGFHENMPATGVGEMRKFSRSELSETFGPDAKEVVIEQLDSVRARVATSGAPTGAIWEYCWGLIRQRGKLKDSRELGRLIGILSARFYHSRRYQSFVYASCVKSEAEKLPKAAGFPSNRLVIDLNFLTPPTSILTSILQAGARIIFVSTEPKTLMTALNMIYNRLERHMGAVQVRHLWHEQVAWFSGHADAAKSPILRWSADDRVMIVAQDGTFEFLRLDGNSSQAEKGIMEAVNALSRTARDTPSLLGIIPLIASGLYESPFKTSKLPLSIFVRSSFFQEAMHIARHCGNDIQNVIQNLKSQGWGFAGDEEAWDRFLSSRMDIYNFDRSYQNLGFNGLSQTEWSIGSFKHARSVTKKLSDKSEFRWSATHASQHLAIYLGLLVLHLCQSASQKDTNIVDHIAAVALGFPVGMGTPVGYIRERGSRKISFYSRTNWPGINVDAAVVRIRHTHDVL
jgi:hypothetical protein